MQNTMELFEACLRDRNLKHSKPRRIIVEVFLTSGEHLTAQELYERVRRKNPRIGFATVYRTLKLLEECNLARSMDYGDGTQRYEPNSFQHHHIICTSCNRTIEFLSPELESLLQQVQRNHNFVPQVHAVRLLSVCVDCKDAVVQSGRRSGDPEAILSRDALRVAIANEQQGLRFYRRALEVTGDVATQEVFAYLADEEEQHLATLQQEYDELRLGHPWLETEPALLYVDHERLAGIFPMQQFEATSMAQPVHPVEALYLAMLAEQRSYELFTDYANNVEHPTGRDIFLKFAQEEQRHLALIRQTYDTLQEREQPPDNG